MEHANTGMIATAAILSTGALSAILRSRRKNYQSKISRVIEEEEKFDLIDKNATPFVSKTLLEISQNYQTPAAAKTPLFHQYISHNHQNINNGLDEMSLSSSHYQQEVVLEQENQTSSRVISNEEWEAIEKRQFDLQNAISVTRLENRSLQNEVNELKSERELLIKEKEVYQRNSINNQRNIIDDNASSSSILKEHEKVELEDLRIENNTLKQTVHRLDDQLAQFRNQLEQLQDLLVKADEARLNAINNYEEQVKIYESSMERMVRLEMLARNEAARADEIESKLNSLVKNGAFEADDDDETATDEPNSFSNTDIEITAATANDDDYRDQSTMNEFYVSDFLSQTLV